MCGKIPHNKTLKDLWNLTKILRDPEFSKDPSTTSQYVGSVFLLTKKISTTIRGQAGPPWLPKKWSVNHCEDFLGREGKISFWASGNYTRQADFESKSPEWWLTQAQSGCQVQLQNGSRWSQISGFLWDKLWPSTGKQVKRWWHGHACYNTAR